MSRPEDAEVRLEDEPEDVESADESDASESQMPLKDMTPAQKDKGKIMSAIKWGTGGSYMHGAFGTAAALLVATGIIQLLLTQLTTGATAGSVVNVIISENLPYLNFNFAQYPMDIFTGTAALVVGVFLALATKWAPAIIKANYYNNDMWLRSFIFTLVTVMVTFWLAQVFAITETLSSLLPMVVLASTIPLFWYAQERMNARSLPGQFSFAMLVLRGGSSKGASDLAIKRELGADKSKHLQNTSWLMLNFGLYVWIAKWCTLGAFGISTAMAQGVAENVATGGTLCHARQWFTITALVCFFLLELFYAIAFYVRFSKDSLHLRRPLTFEGAVFLLLVVIVPMMLMCFLTFGLGYSIHVATINC